MRIATIILFLSGKKRGVFVRVINPVTYVCTYVGTRETEGKQNSWVCTIAFCVRDQLNSLRLAQLKLLSADAVAQKTISCGEVVNPRRIHLNYRSGMEQGRLQVRRVWLAQLRHET